MKTKIPLLLLSIILLAACNRSRVKYQKAKVLKKISSFEDIINEFPDDTYADSARLMIHELEYIDIKKSNSISDFEDYCEKYPNSILIADAKIIIDSLTVIDFYKSDKSIESGTVNSIPIESLKRYRLRNPTDEYSDKIENTLIDYDEFIKAKNADWHTQYKEYLSKYPKGLYIEAAKKRLKFLEENKAKIRCDFPQSISGGPSSYTNVSGPLFQYSITFSGDSNRVGYKIRGKGWYYDKDGEAWGSNKYSGNTTGELEIRPGGFDMYKSWFRGERFIGGYISFQFTGEDAGGHSISKNVRIECK